MLKVPHLRNQYQKVGMFGLPTYLGPFFAGTPVGDSGDQVRGFGFFHDGGLDTVFRFVSGFRQGDGAPEGLPSVDDDPNNPLTTAGETLARQVEAYMLTFPSNLAPIVGQQVTLTSTSAAGVGDRISLLEARADAGECDLVVKGHEPGREVGFLNLGSGNFQKDRQMSLPISEADLRHLASPTAYHPIELTFTCAPPGSGVRLGIDRDGGGFLDGDERDQGSDPANPLSTP